MDLGSTAAARPPGTFVGRRADLDRLSTLATAERLVTVTGPGGAGKTRLVEEALRGRAHAVVELAGTGAGGDPAVAALAACGLREEPGREPGALLAERLGDVDGILVLDNCEHLRDAVATTVADLLRRCPGLRIVATGRVPLGVPGEMLLPLSGLDPDGAGADLLLDRVRRLQPDLPDDDRTRDDAARICRMADGLPLAIELAAAHARALPLSAIRDGMADRMGFLVARGGAAPARHASLTSSLDWSAELVGPAARDALRCLTLLDGRFELDAARAATGDPEAFETLVEHSLVRFDAADGRYLLLDTVRAYAAGPPGAPDTGTPDTAALDRLLDWASAVAREVRDGLERARPDALDRAVRADAAICSVLDQVCEAGRGLPVAARIVEDLAFGWSLRGRCATGLARARAVAAAVDPVPAGLAWAHGFLAFYDGDLETGLSVAARAAASADDRVRGRALILLGMAQAFVDPTGAGPVLTEAVAAATAAGDDWGRVEAAQCLAYSHLLRGDTAGALASADSVLAELTRSGHGQLRAWDGAIRADAAATRGRWAEAIEHGRCALELATTVGEPVSAAGAWLPLLRALVATGRTAEADAALSDGAQFLATHPGLGTDDVVALAGAVVASAGSPERALAAAAAALDRVGLVPAGVAETGVLLATAHLRAGDPGAAAVAARAAERVADGLGHRALGTAARLAVVAAERADGQDVSARAQDLLAEADRLGLCPLVADALDLLAATHRDGGRDVPAARLHAAAARMRAVLGAVAGPLATELAPPPGWPDGDAVARAWAEGTELGDDGGTRAVALARRTRGRRGRPRAGWDSLTPTEREVVAQVATGRSNAEIGACLLVSPGTVRTHLRSVFAKLGVTSRTELAARSAALSADRQM